MRVISRLLMCASLRTVACITFRMTGFSYLKLVNDMHYIIAMFCHYKRYCVLTGTIFFFCRALNNIPFLENLLTAKILKKIKITKKAPKNFYKYDSEDFSSFFFFSWSPHIPSLWFKGFWLHMNLESCPYQ